MPEVRCYIATWVGSEFRGSTHPANVLLRGIHPVVWAARYREQCKKAGISRPVLVFYEEIDEETFLETREAFNLVDIVEGKNDFV